MASNKIDKKTNEMQRLEWIKFWIDYMKKNPNSVWSKEQTNFINSVMRSSDMSPEVYMKIKKLVKKKL